MTRHKCIVCFGQSNMEGMANIADLPVGTLSRWIGKSATVADTNYRVAGINYWMADLDTSATIATYTGKFTPQQFFYSTQAAWAGNGFNYSSTMTTPQAAPISYSGQKFGPDIELSWQIQHELGATEDLFVIKLGIASTWLSKFLQDTGGAAIRWFKYDDVTSGAPPLTVGHNDWHPSSSADYGLSPYSGGNTNLDLFGVLCDIIFVQAQAWIHANKAATDDLDVIGVFMKLGESDSLDPTRAALALQNTRDIRDAMRARIVARGMSSRKAENVPFIIAGHDTKVWTFASTVNAAFQQLADDDLWTGYFDTTGLPTNVGDQAHINATGQITLGQAYYTKWKEVISRESNATRENADLVTLLSMRTQVKRRYERNTVGNELQDTNVNQFLNDTIREVLNTLGDDCWFMRQISTLTPSGLYPSTFNLPRSMKRLLRVESTVEPGRAVVWKGLGYVDNGRLQIALHDYTGGPYVAHYTIKVKDLGTDQDVTIIPQDYVELVVVLTCKRLAESVGNAAISQYYQVESDRLWKYVKREVQRYDRARQEALATTDTWDTWRNGGFPDPLWYL